MVYLTPDQTACSARIFLNVFGLFLEDKKDLCEDDKLKIVNSNNESVGVYYLDDGNAFIEVNNNGNILKANYLIPKTDVMIDWESNGAKCAYWSTPIKFEYDEKDNCKINGLITIGSGMDTELGLKCHIHSEFDYIASDNKKIKFRIYKDGTLFEADINNDDINEKIDILASYNEFMGYSILHRTMKGNYLKFSELGMDHDQDNLKHLMVREVADINKRDYLYVNDLREEKKPMDGYDINLFRDIELVKKEDLEMFNKIKLLIDTIKVGDTKLLQNLVNVSFDRYPDEIIKAIFDIDRDNKVYQDGAVNLIESYFGKNISKTKSILNS